MTEVGSAYVAILPSTRGFGRRLSSDLSGPAGSAGQDAGKRAGQGFSRGLLPSISGVAKAAGGLLAGSALFGLGKLGLGTAAGMEQAKISFETMLGSAKKADVFLKSLAAFAAKTPFEFPELQSAASSLISAGIEANKVIPIMTTLGDVTSGMGTGSEGVKRATIALQQMSAAGRITGEDLNQLRDAGIPVYDLLAKATGKSKAEVVKLAQAGKLGSKELGQMMKALETGAGLERFSGLMDKQSQSLVGLWSTFKDTLGQGLARLITPAIPALKKGLGAVSTNLGGFIDGITGKFEALKGKRSPFQVLGLGLRAVKLAFKEQDVTADGFVGVMERVGVAARSVFDTLSEAARTVFPVLKQVLIGTVIPAVTDLYRAIQPLLIQAFRTAVGAVKTMAPAFRALGAVVRGVAGFLKEHKTIVQAVGVAVLAGVVAFKLWRGAILAWSAVTKAATAVQAAFTVVMNANPIMLVVVAVAALAAGLIYAYKHSETFRNIVDKAFHVVGQAFDFVRDHWKLFLAVLFPALTPIIVMVNQIVAHFGTLKTIVTGAFSAVGAAAKGMWNGVLRPTFRFIADAWFTVVGALVNGAAKAFGWVPGIGPKLKAAAAAFNKFRDQVNASLDGINNDVKVVVTAIYHDPTHGDSDYTHRASGGPVVAGRPYIWQEPSSGGELFVPDVNGQVLNRRQIAAALSSTTMPANGGSGPLYGDIHVMSAPNERAEESLPRTLRALAWADG